LSNHDSALPRRPGPLTFFEDLESLRWRYSAADYERVSLNGQNSAYVIYKKGAANQYMRICQWSLEGRTLTFPQIAGLIKVAQREGAMGVRWAIYGQDEPARALVRRLRWFGFLCLPRARTLQIKSGEGEFLRPENWNLTNAMFSFHW